MSAARAGRLAALAACLLLAGPLAAQTPGDEVEVELTDGTIVRGRVVSVSEDSIVLESGVLGRLVVDRAWVKHVNVAEEPERGGARQIYRTDPDHNTIMLGPTPEVLPAGSAYFRNFELLILNFGMSVSDNLSLSIGTIFPVSSEVASISGGFKLKLTSRETQGVGLALAANGTVIDDEQLASLIGIVGIGDKRNSLNLSVHHSMTESGSASYFIVGADVQVGGSFKLLAEYANSTDAVLEDEDFNGFLNLGFRVFGRNSSFSLSGFRPLETDGGDLIAFPVAMYSHQL